MTIIKIKDCANSVCNNSFKVKNPKKKYCCMHCKNQAAYNYKLQEYEWEIEMDKNRKKNIQILEYLYNKENFRVNTDELIKLGFHAGASYLPFMQGKDLTVFRFGNIYVRKLTNNEFQLFKSN
jgi:hypothetical protein